MDLTLKELEAKKKKALIDNFLDKFMQAKPDMYYASSNEIAREIHTYIASNFSSLSVEHKVLLQSVTAKDIEVILSFK